MFGRFASLVMGLSVILLVETSVLVGPSLGPHFEYRSPRGFTLSGAQPDFLMQLETDHCLVTSGGCTAIDLTPVNGFVGNVTLTAALSPTSESAPAVSILHSVQDLNASLPGTLVSVLMVNETSTTEPGLYTVTIKGSSGSISHSSIATIGVTSEYVPPNSAELLYRGHFTQVAYSGSSTVLNSTFIDLGYVDVGVTNLTLTTMFGTYQHTRPYSQSNCPALPGSCYAVDCVPPPCSIVYLSPYERDTYSLTVQIPMNTSPGNYTVTAIVSWVLKPGTIYQQSAPDLFVLGYLMVYPKLSPQPSPQPSPVPNGMTAILDALRKILLPIIVGVSIAAVIAVGVVIWNERLRRNGKPVSLAPKRLSWRLV